MKTKIIVGSAIGIAIIGGLTTFGFNHLSTIDNAKSEVAKTQSNMQASLLIQRKNSDKLISDYQLKPTQKTYQKSKEYAKDFDNLTTKYSQANSLAEKQSIIEKENDAVNHAINTVQNEYHMDTFSKAQSTSKNIQEQADRIKSAKIAYNKDIQSYNKLLKSYPLVNTIESNKPLKEASLAKEPIVPTKVPIFQNP